MEHESENLNKQEKRIEKKERKEVARATREKQRILKKVIFWIAVIVFLGGSVYAMIQAGGSGGGSVGNGRTLSIQVDQNTDWTKGKAQAPLQIVEYSDFQCPACGAYFAPLKALEEELGDKLQIVYRHFPLRQIHFNADTAARAAEAAGMQGKFWEMHDMLFGTQSQWSNFSSNEMNGALQTIAQEIGLDIDSFNAYIASDEAKKSVNDDYASGSKSGVNSTPTFFLNGDIISGLSGPSELREILIDALTKTETQ